MLSFSHWHAKGFSSKHIALKVDGIGPENLLFAGASAHLSSRKIGQAGAVKGLTLMKPSSTRTRREEYLHGQDSSFKNPATSK